MANPAYATPAYRKSRAVLLAGDPVCHYCGRPASEADHIPPISTHRHVEGSGCCELRPSCPPCARRQGAILAGRGARLPRPAPMPVATTAVSAPALDPAGWPADDPTWDRPWLDGLRDVPADATWPRLMTPPHPAAVDSYGGELAAAAAARTGRPLRWWQHLAAVRLLEHDDQGALVWGTAAVSVARQLGKSWLLAELAMWRITQGDRFDAQQLVVHTGKDLAVCVEVQRDARIWARNPARLDRFGEPVWKVRESNGQQTVEYVADGSRWIVLASRAVQGRRASLAFVDEAWAVDARSVAEDLTPALSAQPSNQLVLVSTAHSKATDLMVGHRNLVAADLESTDGPLWLEWSAPQTVGLDDEAGWRAASPHWDDRRRQFVAVRYAAAVAGHDDADTVEDDPVTSFVTQWLNRWPTRRRRAGHGEPLLAEGVWESCAGYLDHIEGPGVIALEENRGEGAAAAFVAADGTGRYELDGRACPSWSDAINLARTYMTARPGARILVGARMNNQLPGDFPGRNSAGKAGTTETGRGLSLLRALTAERRVVHDATRDLDDQLARARVHPLASGGLGLVNNGTRADLLRACLWALDAAQKPAPNPRIH